MLFDNPIFESWYTDSMTIYRNEDVVVGNVDKKQRVMKKENVPCRVYSSQKNGARLGRSASYIEVIDKVACDLSVDLKSGDELYITRGGRLGMQREQERYIAGRIQEYFDPVGGIMSGLEHKEAALQQDNIIK